MGSEGFELLTVTTFMTTVITSTTFTNVRHPAEREDTIVVVLCLPLYKSMSGLLDADRLQFPQLFASLLIDLPRNTVTKDKTLQRSALSSLYHLPEPLLFVW